MYAPWPQRRPGKQGQGQVGTPNDGREQGSGKVKLLKSHRGAWENKRVIRRKLQNQRMQYVCPMATNEETKEARARSSCQVPNDGRDQGSWSYRVIKIQTPPRCTIQKDRTVPIFGQTPVAIRGFLFPFLVQCAVRAFGMFAKSYNGQKDEPNFSLLSSQKDYALERSFCLSCKSSQQKTKGPKSKLCVFHVSKSDYPFKGNRGQEGG